MTKLDILKQLIELECNRNISKTDFKNSVVNLIDLYLDDNRIQYSVTDRGILLK